MAADKQARNTKTPSAPGELSVSAGDPTRRTTIASLMVERLVSVEPTDTIVRAAQQMKENGVGAVLVVANGELVGMLSERDIVERVVADGKDPATTQVDQVASRTAIGVLPDASIDHCAAILQRGGFRHLPVVDGTRPIGIVSARDLFAHAVGLGRVIDEERYRDQLDGGVDPYADPGGGYAR